MKYEIHRRARTIAILSIITSVTVILLAQLMIGVKHVFVSLNCSESLSLTEAEAILHSEDVGCNGTFDFTITVIDVILVAITLFSVLADLPTNIILLIAINSNISWMFIPWLIVTLLKIVGCVATICLLMYIPADNDLSFPPHQQEDKTTACLDTNT